MISVSIMAHPSREEYIPYLKEKLGDVPVAWDLGDGIWANRVKATLMFNPEATHHLVVQDDAVICKDFYKLLDEEIAKRPDHAFCLYFGNRRSTREIARENIDKGGVEMDWFSWGVAIVLPTKIIPDMIDWCSKLDKYEKNDDTRLGLYMRQHGLKVWYPLPSLVDHKTEKESLVNSHEGAGKCRVAFSFVGE